LKKEVRQGSIFAVRLEKGLGYGYLKLIVTAELGFLPQFIYKILDYRTEILETFDETKFKYLDELTYPFLSLQKPSARTKNWILIGNISLSESDILIPDFKTASKNWDTDNWDSIQWSVITGLQVNKPIHDVPFNKVKHLGPWQHSSLVYIITRLTLFWIKKMNLNITDFYSVDEIQNECWLEAGIYEVNNLQFYNNISFPERYKLKK
jgi:hypothetical protein